MPDPLSVKDLGARYAAQDIKALDSVSWNVKPASLSAVIGPNGAGKSTFLKCIMGLLPSQTGEVSFFSQSLEKSRKRISYMPQRSEVDWTFPVSVFDVTLMGTYGTLGMFSPIGKIHKEKALHALEKVGMQDLKDRQIGALSGGQQQRTFLARALAQDADLYLMDEPMGGVDITTQNVIIDILKDIKAEGKTVVVVHHDLSTVGKVFDTALLLNKHMIASGAVKDVLAKENLAKAYGVPL